MDSPTPSEAVRLEVVASVLMECKGTRKTNKSVVVISIREKSKKMLN